MTDVTTTREDALRAREQARKRAGKGKSRRRSRYDRPRQTIIWTVLLFGVAVGLVGGLYYAWIVQPLNEAEVAPWQLRTARDTDDLLPDRDAYIMAILLAHEHEPNLSQTVQRLIDLRLSTDDPIQYVADLACRLVRGGYVDSNSNRNAVRSMMRFYQQQGKAGCADQLILMDGRDVPTPTTIVVPTATLVPPATKTPAPQTSPTPETVIESEPFVAPPAPAGSFNIVVFEPFCNRQNSGVIEVIVRNVVTGAELPGYPVRVTGDGVDSTFFTGMKPERGLGYADYRMAAGGVYNIEMPGLSAPTSREIRALDCLDDVSGAPAIRSYRIVFAGN